MGRTWNMSDPYYYLYAFARADCSTAGIGAGVDPRFPVELVCDGPTAAVVSRIGLDQFDPARLQGGKAEDLAWLTEVAARHDEIIRLAAGSSPVAPLRMGTVFHSLDSLRAAIGRLQASVVEFFRQLGDRQEWGVKLYRSAVPATRQNVPVLAASATPSRPGVEYLRGRKPLWKHIGKFRPICNRRSSTWNNASRGRPDRTAASAPWRAI